MTLLDLAKELMQQEEGLHKILPGCYALQLSPRHPLAKAAVLTPGALQLSSLAEHPQCTAQSALHALLMCRCWSILHHIIRQHPWHDTCNCFACSRQPCLLAVTCLTTDHLRHCACRLLRQAST